MKKNRKQIALVTGASSGMGRYFVLELARQYPSLCEIWVIARRKHELERLRRELEGTGLRLFPLDLSLSVSFDRISDELERERPCIRFLVNAAGVGYTGLTEDQNPDEIGRMIDINCRALILLTRICLPYLDKESRILQLASGSAFAPQPGFAVYAASKACVLSFSRALREELRPRGIHVTSICPGPVRTEFFENGGIHLSPMKKYFLADPQRVVRKAIRDAAKGKALSVYGFSMKLVHLASGILPQGAMAWLSRKIF